MSSIVPPNWLGSIIQTHGARARSVQEREQEGAAQSEREADVFAGKLRDAIDNTDRDGQVYADAEGAGSQGRPFEGAALEQPSVPDDADPDEGGHLDVQA